MKPVPSGFPNEGDAGETRTDEAGGRTPLTAIPQEWDDEVPVIGLWRSARRLGLPLEVIDPRQGGLPRVEPAPLLRRGASREAFVEQRRSS